MDIHLLHHATTRGREVVVLLAACTSTIWGGGREGGRGERAREGREGGRDGTKVVSCCSMALLESL